MVGLAGPMGPMRAALRSQREQSACRVRDLVSAVGLFVAGPAARLAVSESWPTDLERPEAAGQHSTLGGARIRGRVTVLCTHAPPALKKCV